MNFPQATLFTESITSESLHTTVGELFFSETLWPWYHSFPQLHSLFVLPRVSNPVSVRRLVLAAGWGSGLALELRRILASPRWFDAWLWIQEEEHRIFNVVNVYYRVRRKRFSIGVLLDPKAKHQTNHGEILLSPVFRWSLAPYNMAAVSKRSNLFLFCLEIKLKKT